MAPAAAASTTHLAVLLLAVLHLRAEADGACGYDACSPTYPDMLNVHLVPHSHDDVGWLKTVDQYYAGLNRRDISYVGVQDILDSVVRELAFYPHRKFIQVETAFFWRWWEQQGEATRDIVRDLVSGGQLEFVGGGWSMNDEGAAHYAAVVDNMELGFRLLKQEFGDCGIPKVAWQIDSFGHSREQAHLFKMMGLEAMFLGRVDWRDRGQRVEDAEMEMLWTTSDDKSDSELLTCLNYNYYFPPPGFCWDYWCEDEPIMDDDDEFDDYFNARERAAEFAAFVRYQALSFRTSNVLLTMGQDFNYQAANYWYKNMDRLIEQVELLQEQDQAVLGDGPKINLMYSTPSCYAKAVKEADLADFPAKQQDFFPYASDPHAYWTGYFSSRPTSKRLMHEADQALLAYRQMASVMYSQDPTLDSSSPSMSSLLELEKAVGVAQHHDAITGTEKQKVAEDYHRRLSRGVDLASNAMLTSSSASSFFRCPLANVSLCDQTEASDEFTVAVYNPMARTRNWYVRLPVSGQDWKVTKVGDGSDVACQALPITQTVLDIPGDHESAADHDLVFKAVDLAALATETYLVQRQEDESPSRSVETEVPPEGLLISDAVSELTIDGDTGLASAFRSLPAGEEYEFRQELMWYTGHAGNNSEFEYRASGAYIFRPVEVEPNSFGSAFSSSVWSGAVLTEIRTTFSDYASQVMRKYNDDDWVDVEVEWLVGPIPVDDGEGKEIINHFSLSDAGVGEDGTFLTDANGRQMMQRTRDKRETFEFEVTEPVAENYYPVNNRIRMRDPSTGAGLTVLNDRAQAGGSILDHTMELLIHRRLLYDDAFGVGEALDEEAYGEGLVARGKHYMLFDADSETASRRHRRVGTETFAAPQIVVKSGEATEEELAYFSGLSANLPVESELPENLNLMTLRPWLSASDDEAGGPRYLVRVEHTFQEAEHADLGQPTTFDLSALLSPLGEVTSARETTLGANVYLDEESEDETTWLSFFAPWAGSRQVEGDFLFTVGAMDIRTFVVETA